MKPRHPLAGLLGLILLLSAPVTWLTSLDEPGFVIAKLVLSVLALGYYGRAVFAHHQGRLKGRGGLHAWISAQWLVALVVAGSVLVGFFEQRAIVWDLTSDHVYTSAPETQQLLAQAVEPIKFKVFWRPSSRRRRC